ncbi:hypothetical protein BHE16_07700 [Neomicrococcus aestuarii]|uniref:AB hydrolase-1 domain-containing protein n=2 Tax=Neomicrococcus aestuarii TaxID=556325 RepID=A0A1L2ZR35_9MICC|nr:hypothetical protein BHE16_07700 [Neomicrococcus aestuarii]
MRKSLNTVFRRLSDVRRIPVVERDVVTPDGGVLALASYGNAHADGNHRVLVVGGAFITALIYRPFAQSLAVRLGKEWGVDVYDRRGRGGSTEQPSYYNLDLEISDLATMMRATGARNLFGHSLGGSVVLNAVQSFTGHGTASPKTVPGGKAAFGDSFEDPTLIPAKLAVYDAALNIDGSLDAGWLTQVQSAAADGKWHHAIAHVQRGMKTLPTLSKVPEPILAALVLLTRPTPFGKRVKTLLPTGVGELSAALTEEDHAEDFASLPEGTRFMAGSLSPEYFRVTAQRLHAVVSGSTYEESPKLWHGAVPAAMKELIDDIAEYFTAQSTGQSTGQSTE